MHGWLYKSRSELEHLLGKFSWPPFSPIPPHPTPGPLMDFISISVNYTLRFFRLKLWCHPGHLEFFYMVRQWAVPIRSILCIQNWVTFSPSQLCCPDPGPHSSHLDQDSGFLTAFPVLILVPLWSLYEHNWFNLLKTLSGFPGGSVVTNLPANVGDVGLIPGLGRSPGQGNGNPLQYSCLENSSWTEEPGRLQWQKDRQDWVTNTFKTSVR